MSTSAPTQRRRYLPLSSAQQHQQQLRPSHRMGSSKGVHNHNNNSVNNSNSKGLGHYKREILFFGTLICVISMYLIFVIIFMIYNTRPFQLEDYQNGPIHFHDDKPILIVGGTDGSGTRAFMDTLDALGAVSVYDDLSTFDVHAVELFHKQGWPAFVTTILQQTHSANYQWSDLPNDIQHRLRIEVSKLQVGLEQRYKREKSRRNRNSITAADSASAKSSSTSYFLGKYLKRRKNKSSSSSIGSATTSTELASKISFAVKAPVSMLVLPVLREIFDRPIKFLHVVRDGRDIALSDNQSPVLKFYETMYEHDTNYTSFEQAKVYGQENVQPVRAIHLWNDWNLQVQQMLKTQQQKSSTKKPPIEFLTMRSEDLLSEETRWRALQALADFIGSPLSLHDLCCKAYEDTKDFGQSTIHQRGVNDRHFDLTNNNSNNNKDNNKSQKKPNNNKKSSPLRRRLLQTEDERAGIQTWQLFIKDFTETKEIVDTRAKAMQMEQLEEWIMQAHHLEGLWRFIQKSHPSAIPSDIPISKLSSDLKDLTATLEKYIIRLKSLDGMRDIEKEPGSSSKRNIDGIPRERIEDVHKRYGKWQKLLTNRPKLSEYLHQQGKEALRVFGYEPQQKSLPYKTLSPSSVMRVHSHQHNSKQQHNRTILNSNVSSAVFEEERPFVCTKHVVCRQRHS